MLDHGFDSVQMLLELASFTMIAAALRLFHECDAIALHAIKIEQELFFRR